MVNIPQLSQYRAAPSLRRLAEEGPSASLYGITQTEGTFDAVAIELGVYFLLLSFCMLQLLDQVRGKPGKLENWLYFRKLTIFRQDERNSERVTNYLKFVLYYYMAMPFITLLGWTILVLYSNSQEEHEAWAGICILVLGLALNLLGYNFLKVKWSNYRFKLKNLYVLLVVLALVTAYQCMIVFGYEHKDKFLPYSALFLNLNVTLLAILAFLSKYKDQKGINDIVTKFFPKSGKDLDRNRDDDMIGEIDAQAKDPSWV